MRDYISISAPEIFFVSDTHFRNRNLPGEPERRKRFIAFMQGIPAGAAVFLLGDIFDFYFEYSTVIAKRYFDIFNALYECRRRGVALHFLGGNHDCWAGDFLRGELGVTIHKEKTRLACQGRRIVCTHGDLVMPRDIGYKVLRTVIRNPLVVTAAKLLHPDLLEAIARRISKWSKGFQTESSHRAIAQKLGETAHKRFFADGNDSFVMGHIHYPLHVKEGGREFLILGDWIDHFTFGKLAEGNLALETFKA